MASNGAGSISGGEFSQRSSGLNEDHCSSANMWDSGKYSTGLDVCWPLPKEIARLRRLLAFANQVAS